MLLKEGVDLTAQNDQKETALDFAIIYNKKSLVDLFLGLNKDGKKLNNHDKAKVLLSNVNYMGDTPLHIAAKSKGVGIVKSLISCKDINFSARNNEGYDPLQCAVVYGNSKVFEYIAEKGRVKDGDVQERRISLGEIHEQTGNTVLHMAVKNGNLKIVYYLSKALQTGGKEINAQNKKGQTALHIAVSNNSDKKNKNKKIIDKLLDKKINVNAQDENGKTALHIAIEQNKTDLAIKLLKRGADPNIQDDKKNTPIHLAVLSRNTKWWKKHLK